MTPEEQTLVAVQVGELRTLVEERNRKLDAIHESLKDDLRRIEVQTTQTNGRVTSHDKQLAMLKGAVAVLTFATPFLLLALDHLS